MSSHEETPGLKRKGDHCYATCQICGLEIEGRLSWKYGDIFDDFEGTTVPDIEGYICEICWDEFYEYDFSTNPRTVRRRDE